MPFGTVPFFRRRKNWDSPRGRSSRFVRGPKSPPTAIDTVTTLLSSVPSLALYVNVSTPLNPVLGEYVNVPSELNCVSVPLLGLATTLTVSELPSGSRFRRNSSKRPPHAPRQKQLRPRRKRTVGKIPFNRQPKEPPSCQPRCASDDKRFFAPVNYFANAPSRDRRDVFTGGSAASASGARPRVLQTEFNVSRHAIWSSNNDQ